MCRVYLVRLKGGEGGKEGGAITKCDDQERLGCNRKFILMCIYMSK